MSVCYQGSLCESKQHFYPLLIQANFKSSDPLISFVFLWLKLIFFFTLYPKGLNNIIHIDFDYKKEFVYWVDSTRPSGRKINRMRLNGSDLKVSCDVEVCVSTCCVVVHATPHKLHCLYLTYALCYLNLYLWSKLCLAVLLLNNLWELTTTNFIMVKIICQFEFKTKD